MIELVKAGTSDALVINSISKRSFESDVAVGALDRKSTRLNSSHA